MKYPFFPETTKANIYQFTDYQKEKKGHKINEKLMLKFTGKEDYVIYGEMLDCYLDHDKKVENIKIKNKLKFEKSKFKLMNNAFYRKTVEDVYKRQDVEIVNDVNRYI